MGPSLDGDGEGLHTMFNGVRSPASMGPSLDGDGESSGVLLVWDYELLQWGRRSMATESWRDLS